MKKTLLLAFTSLLLTIAACKKAAPIASAPPASTGTPTVATAPGRVPAYLSKLTPNELKWGISPTRNDKVTYQPDVIIMEHGSDAVRAMASNGMTWTIDANAPGANEIAEGKILFATGRVVGRVLKVDSTPEGLAVTLGPVAITEVIKECDIKSEQPLDFASAVVYTAPDYPGATTKDEPERTSLGEPVVPVFFASYQAPAAAAALLSFGAPAAMMIEDFLVTPVCCKGLGITMQHTGKGATITATAAVELANPSVKFALVIHKSTIYTAMVQLTGTAGFRVHFAAGTDKGIEGNIKQNFFLPVDNVWPIVGAPVPLSVVIRQTIRVETIFTAQNGTLEATGEYGFTGDFKAGKENGGAWGVSGPMSVTTKQNLANTLSGASLGVNGLVFAYGAKVMVGIGAFGFVTGPFVGYNTVVAVNRSPDESIQCGSGTLNTSMRYGVGYQMPEVVTKVINIFMHALGIKKDIDSEGGYEAEEKLINKTDYYPAGCFGSKSSGN